jgi:hypothetical protein
LIGSDPEVWRLFEVPRSARLGQLHRVLQCVMGWTDSHLHAFTTAEPYAWPRADDARRWEDLTIPGFAWSEGDEPDDEDATSVGELLREGSPPLYYEYDFGDGWVHAVEWVADGAAEPGPGWIGEIVEGGGLCPQEDSGGLPGWCQLVDAVADPANPDRVRLKMWAAGSISPDGLIHPERFDREAASKRLAQAGALDAYQREFENRAEAPTLFDKLMQPLAWGQRMWLARQFEIDPAFLSCADPGQVDNLGDIAPDVLDRMTRHYRWLLGRIGDNGLALTKAGYLPPAVVREAYVELGFNEELLEGRQVREGDSGPVAALRMSAQELGLLRKTRGVLHVTRDAAKAASDPVVLLRFMIRRLANKGPERIDQVLTALVALGLAFADEWDEDEFWDAIAEWAGGIGWRLSSGEPLKGPDVRAIAGWARAFLMTTGALIEAGGWTEGYTITPGAGGRELARAVLVAPVKA